MDRVTHAIIDGGVYLKYSGLETFVQKCVPGGHCNLCLPENTLSCLSLYSYNVLYVALVTTLIIDIQCSYIQFNDKTHLENKNKVKIDF